MNIADVNPAVVVLDVRDRGCPAGEEPFVTCAAASLERLASETSRVKITELAIAAPPASPLIAYANRPRQVREEVTGP